MARGGFRIGIFWNPLFMVFSSEVMVFRLLLAGKTPDILFVAFRSQVGPEDN